MTPWLSSGQQNVLEALRRVCADGWPANVREIMREASLASPSTAQAHLVSLERLGLVETNPRQPSRRGGWRPTAAGLQQPTPPIS